VCWSGIFAKLSKGKCRVLSLGRNSLRQQGRLATDSLQSISAEKALGVLLDIKVTTSHQRAFVAKVATGLLGRVRQNIASRLREVVTPLCSAFVRHMGGCTQLQVPKYKRDMEILD